MTYDQWKTTDPNDRAYREDDEDQPTELELVYDELRDVKEAAKHAAEVAAKRISELTASLEEALEYFVDHSDVNDGDYGESSPNKEMALASMIDETLHGIKF